MPRLSRSTPSMDPDAFPADRFVLRGADYALDCRPGSPEAGGAHVMGILNVTPDSFSDGGQYVTVEKAVSRAAEMLSEGASIIDVGGESTRPGADPVSKEDERDRVVPVIDALADQFPEAVVSVDTYKPDVARAALAAGADVVNDVTGLRHGPEMAEAAADWKVPLMLMHSAGEPGDLTRPREYADVTAEVRDGLARAVETARQAGVEQVVVDPGFGFGKSDAENLRLLNEIDELLTLNCPVLVGVSRKSTIGATLGTPDNPAPVDERLYGSLGATAAAVTRGATIVRTHDVAPTVDLLKVLGATLRQR
ncbi:MAG: dihydropteroate synthase [Salinibacter sp.]|jgi:Dihydropteroate synthase (EC 2.5.1.15)|uniref:dihydropteroate synthase n=1 Tax=Salinibacter sp. TaxID=2065818 RepID=UPI002FC3302D